MRGVWKNIHPENEAVKILLTKMRRKKSEKERIS